MSYRILLLFSLFSHQLFSQIVFNNYATINSIGICFELPTDDAEHDLQATLQYKKVGETGWKNGFELSKSNTFNNKLINGSVFRCEANTTYHLRISLNDPTTNTLNGSFLDTLTTKKIIDFKGFSKTYYVSPSGSGQVFTLNSPGKLIDAFTNVQAGEKIILLGGTYYEGNFTLNQLGTTNSPIIIEGLSGQQIIMDGSQPNPVWTADASVSGYKTTITNQNCNVVIADGIRLYPHKASKELKYHKIPWENTCRDALVDGFFRSGNNNTLRIKFRDNSDPSLKDIKIGLYDYCFNVDQAQNIIIKNITFKYFGTNNKAAIVLKNAENIQILNCKFGFNDEGVLLQEATKNIVIDSSEFYDSNGNWNFWRMKATYQGTYLPGCSGNDIIADNASGSTVVNAEGNRALEKGGVFVSGNYSGKGIMISHSKFHDIVQGLMITPQSWWTDTGMPLEIDFNNNEVYNCSEDGLEADIFPRNVRIWENNFHDVNMAISTAVGANGPTYIFNNIFHGFTTDTNWVASWGNTNPGRALKVNAGSPSDDGGDLFFMHNTIYSTGDQYAMDLLKESPQKWSKFTFINNIYCSGTKSCFRLRADSLGIINSGSNCFFNTGNKLIEFQNSSFTSLPVFQNQFGFETNSINSNPLFKDANNIDLSLMNNSPLVDAGQIIVGLNDLFKHCPDIGAIESFENCTSTIPCNPTAIICGDTTICAADSATIKIALTGTAPWSITMVVDGVNKTPVTALASPYVFKTEVDGVYTLASITDSSCAGITTGSATIHINGPLNTSIPSTTCNTTNTKYIVEFDITGGDANTYSVSGNTGNLTTSNHFKSDSLNSGSSYSFSVNDSFACSPPIILSGTKTCSTVSLTCNSTAVIIGNTTICAGESAAINLQFTGTPPWSVILAVDGVDQPVFQSSLSTYTFSSNNSATYTITSVSDGSLCNAITSGSAKIVVHPLPTIGTTVNPSSAAVCEGDTVKVNGTGGNVFIWSDAITDNVSFIPLSTKTYTVIGTDLNNCSNSAIRTISVFPKPIVGIIVNPNDTSICLGSQITLNGTGANQYTWTGGISNGAVFTPVTTQTYTVIGTTLNNCSDTATQLIEVNHCNSITSTNDLSQSNIISIYPNPNSGLFTIKIINTMERELFLYIFNMLGTEVYSSTNKIVDNNYKKTIDLSHLAKGIYYIKLSSTTWEKIFKLIIE